MSTAALNIAFDDVARALHGSNLSRPAEEPLHALRVALLYGEELSLPSASRQLQVLSGRAWVSFAGEDYILGSGECLDMIEGKDKAIISAVGGEALFFEIT
jgi:hypothetical protein